MCVKTNSVLYSQEHVFCLVVLLTDWGFLRGNHLPFVGKISYDVCTVCVSVFCVSKGRSWLTVNWQTHTCAHAQDAPEDPNILGLVFFSPLQRPWRWHVPSAAEKHTQSMLMCVERVSLGYTMLPTILGVSSLPSQSQPRTWWCSAPLTGGIPRNCCCDAGLNSSEPLLSLSHLLPLISFLQPRMRRIRRVCLNRSCSTLLLRD